MINKPVDINTLINAKLQNYANIYSKTNISEEEKNAAAYDLLKFHYQNLFLNNPSLPNLSPYGIEEKIKILGFIGWPSSPAESDIHQKLQEVAKERLNIELNNQKYIVINFYRGLMGTREFVVFELI